MKSLKEQVGQAITELRLSKGLKQKDVAVLLGVSESTYFRYESGSQNLTLESIENVAKALKVEAKITFV